MPIYPDELPDITAPDVHDAARKLIRWIWQDNRGSRNGVTTRFYAALYLLERQHCQMQTVRAFAKSAGVSSRALDFQIAKLRTAAMTTKDIQRAKATRRRA